MYHDLANSCSEFSGISLEFMCLIASVLNMRNDPVRIQIINALEHTMIQRIEI